MVAVPLLPLTILNALPQSRYVTVVVVALSLVRLTELDPEVSVILKVGEYNCCLYLFLLIFSTMISLATVLPVPKLK